MSDTNETDSGVVQPQGSATAAPTTTKAVEQMEEEPLPVISHTHQGGITRGVPGCGIATASVANTGPSPDKQRVMEQQRESDADPASRSTQPNPGNQ
jgi:hypothetical protein